MITSSMVVVGVPWWGGGESADFAPRGWNAGRADGVGHSGLGRAGLGEAAGLGAAGAGGGAGAGAAGAGAGADQVDQLEDVGGVRDRLEVLQRAGAAVHVQHR
ncbi:hypothetical protein AB0E96_40765, partial [Kitasatospora sp. NPDC036755]|uniref:hypothetical protein n=1 Tax=Kitasatospora sp. NPDC036755 TaxID=3154600 RepID=UPI00340624B9